MVAFVNICFDRDQTDRISALQRILAQTGISDYAERLGYPPHITLVRVDDANPSALISAAEGILAQASLVEIWLNGRTVWWREACRLASTCSKRTLDGAAWPTVQRP